MELEKLKFNCCPNHPSQIKEFLCLTCKSIYCLTCYQIDRSHRTTIRPISEHLLDNFEIKQYLGAGTFSQVFKVSSIGENLPYALKVIGDINNHKKLELVSTETQLHAKMFHPNILRLNNSFRVKNEGIFVVQLELAETSLAAEIESVSQSTAFSYFRQIMEALRYLHEDMKIAHRNLKPDNILLKQGIVKLCDISDAKVSEKKMVFRNNVIYLPPEVLNGNKYNEKSDIWAAGVVFHMMLNNGKHPFDERDIRDEDEIIENLKNRKIKLDERIKEQKFLEILKSKFFKENICQLLII